MSRNDHNPRWVFERGMTGILLFFRGSVVKMVEEVAVVVRDLWTLALIIHLIRPFVVTTRDEIANLTCSRRTPREASTTCIELVLFTDILIGASSFQWASQLPRETINVGILACSRSPVS